MKLKLEVRKHIIPSILQKSALATHHRHCHPSRTAKGQVALRHRLTGQVAAQTTRAGGRGTGGASSQCLSICSHGAWSTCHQSPGDETCSEGHPQLRWPASLPSPVTCCSQKVSSPEQGGQPTGSDRLRSVEGRTSQGQSCVAE